MVETRWLSLGGSFGATPNHKGLDPTDACIKQASGLSNPDTDGCPRWKVVWSCALKGKRKRAKEERNVVIRS
jgi:hypothetical protein